jgi:hypothetical protein
MESRTAAADNGSAMPTDQALLVDRIHDLLDAHADGAPAPLLATMEHTLTDGYAHALALEGEGMRIEREIGDILLTLKEGKTTRELSALADRLARTETELTRLRELLAVLRRRAETVRCGAEDVRRSRSEPRRPRPGYGFRSAAS